MQNCGQPLVGNYFFFTLYTLEQQPSLCRTHEVSLLRSAFRFAMDRAPFDIEAICLLPEHLHCLLRLPQGDKDYLTRWRLIQAWFSRHHRGRKNIWSAEYLHRSVDTPEDQIDIMDYIHFDPVKHGHCKRAIDWPWSSFHVYVRRGVYEASWGEIIEVDMSFKEKGALWAPLQTVKEAD